MNAQWHQRHPMPARPSVDERIAWHLEHAEHCGCRKIPPKLARLIAQRRRATDSTEADLDDAAGSVEDAAGSVEDAGRCS
jgi:hypothetical protein